MKTKPTEMGIEIYKGWLDVDEIKQPHKRLSLYSMVCVGNMLLHNKKLWRIRMQNSGITKHHVEALNIILEVDKTKVRKMMNIQTEVI